MTSSLVLFTSKFRSVRCKDFEQIKKRENLSINFSEYGKTVLDLLKGVSQCPDRHELKLLVDQDVAELEVTLHTELRSFSLMSFVFLQTDSEILEKHVSANYHRVQAKKRILEQRYIRILKVLRTKVPKAYEKLLNFCF